MLHKSVYGFGGVPQTVQANGFITRPSAIAKFSQSAPLSQYIERIQNPIQNRYPKFYPGSSAEQWNLNPDDKSLGFKNARMCGMLTQKYQNSLNQSKILMESITLVLHLTLLH